MLEVAELIEAIHAALRIQSKKRPITMSYAESKAVFSQRATQIGIEPDVLKAFVDKGFSTMATFAFACQYTPSSSSDRALIEMIKDTLGRDATPLETSLLRRLFAESYANVAADIKSQTEQSEDTPARKLAPAERAQRLKDQQGRLKGLTIRGNYEPGDTLVDRCCQCYEQDRLVYIEWAACISREFELVNNVKKDTSLSFTSEGTLKLAKQEKHQPAATGTEMQVRYCLVRRGLALDQANILTFSKHEQWTEFLMDARMAEPPAGFQQVSMKQLELADKKLFTLMAEQTRAGIKAQTAGKPCDTAFDTCFSSTEVRHLLQPKPVFQGAQVSNVQVSRSPRPSANESPPKRQKGGGKGKGQSKSDSFQRIPYELLKLGAVANTQKGHRLCFSYNLKTCNETLKQQKCSKGLHLCCVRGCHKQHAALDCPNKKAE